MRLRPLTTSSLRALRPALAAALLVLSALDASGQECPTPPRQTQPELDVEARAAVGKLARVTGGDLAVRTRRTVQDLLARVPDANVVYLEQMLFAAYCTTVRDDRSLTPAERSERLARYGREVRAALARAQTPGGQTPSGAPVTPAGRGSAGTGGADAAREQARERTRKRARDSLELFGIAWGDTAAFFDRVKERDTRAVRLFFEAGLSPNLRDGPGGRSGWPAIAVAARAGDSAVVATLLAAGVSPNLATEGGVRPLTIAASEPSPPLVRLLLARGADPGYVERDGATALSEAGSSGDTTVLRLLLEATPAPLRREVLSGTSPRLATPLAPAVRRGWVEGVQLLLAAGAEPGHSAAALVCSAVEMRDTNLPSGDSARGAHRERYLDVTRALVERARVRVDVDCGGGPLAGPRAGPLLAIPARGGDTVMLGYLLAQGADPNRVPGEGTMALHAAANRCDERGLTTTRFLLARGARVDQRDRQGRTALMEACGRTTGLIELLLRAGAAVDARDQDGNTPLLTSGWDTTRVRRLLGAGADPRATNARGETALMRVAAIEPRSRSEPPQALEAVRQLLAAGTPRDARNTDGRTAHEIACEAGWRRLAELLGPACAR